MSPTRRAFFLCALLLGLAWLPVVVTGSGAAPWLTGLAGLGALLLVEALLTVDPSRLEVWIEAPAATPVGLPLAARLEMRAAGLRRRLDVEAWVDTDDGFAPAPQLAFGLLERATRDLPLVATRRGPAHIDRLRLRWRGPLGLLSRRVTVPLDTPIAVTLPALRAHPPTRHLLARMLTSGPRIERHRGDGMAFDSLAPYTSDHDHRRIDWKASARLHAPLVREYRAERSQDLVIALDTGHLMGRRDDGMSRLDHAVLAAQLLALAALRAGDRVGLAAFDAELHARIPPRGGVTSYPVLATALGGLAPSAAETNFTRGLGPMLASLRRRSMVVLMTDLVDATTAALMLEHLERVAARHVLVFVALRDPAIEAARGAPPVDLPALHRAVAAGALAQDRELVFSRLRRAGAIVVETLPQALPGSLLDRYLDVKRRARL